MGLGTGWAEQRQLIHKQFKRGINKMGILIDEALAVCNTGAQMLRVAEALEKGVVVIEGEEMPLSEDFKAKLQVKYDGLKVKVKDKVKDKK